MTSWHYVFNLELILMCVCVACEKKAEQNRPVPDFHDLGSFLFPFWLKKKQVRHGHKVSMEKFKKANPRPSKPQLRLKPCSDHLSTHRQRRTSSMLVGTRPGELLRPWISRYYRIKSQRQLIQRSSREMNEGDSLNVVFRCQDLQALSGARTAGGAESKKPTII